MLQTTTTDSDGQTQHCKISAIDRGRLKTIDTVALSF